MWGRISAVVVLLAVSGCGSGIQPASPPSSLGFVRHDNAVSAPTVDGSVQRLAPDGSVTTLADLHLPWHKPSDETGDSGRANSVVQSGGRLVIGGGQTVGGRSAALTWTSTDGGHTLAPVDLPQAEG